MLRAAPASLHIEPSPRSRRTLSVRWVDGALPGPRDRFFALGEDLQKTLANDGCAAVICTTVARAQQMYMALRKYFPETATDGNPELDLLHSHFLYDEREAREKRSIDRFGKPGPSTFRPYRAVLVSTQIIEQSLDLDFDLILSDFAPMDLLLQRSGRIHRHLRGEGETDRPPGLRAPQLWLCRPPEEARCPSFPNDILVYDEHILLRTWTELDQRTEGEEVTVSLPDDIDELVNTVYGELQAPPDDLSAAARSHSAPTSCPHARGGGPL